MRSRNCYRSGIPACEGKRWTRYKIFYMVNNPKYVEQT